MTGSSTGAEESTGEETSGGPETGGDHAPPNLLLIIADDIGLDKASFDAQDPCYDVGESLEDPPMPNIAALCEAGVRFDNAWSMPTCSPTRATILTGQLPFRHGVGGALGQNNQLSLEATTLPHLLEAAASGYASANIGKWHVSVGASDPNTLGWQHYAGSLTGVLPSYGAWERTENGVTSPAEGYATTRTVDDAIDWLDSLPAEQPWLLWLAFNAPHTPFHKPPEDLHDYDDLPDLPIDMGPGDRKPYYAAMGQAMDTEIGRLIGELKGRGVWENTLVVFVGDNGTPSRVASSPIDNTHAKETLTQGGIAVPMIIAGPGVEGGRALPQLVSLVDLFATLLEAAAVDPKRLEPELEFDSVSLWPLLSGESEAELRDYVVAEQFGGQSSPLNRGKAIRDGEHKLICFEDGRVELYNLLLDPWESIELIGEGDPPAEVVAELSAALESLVGADVCP